MSAALKTAFQEFAGIAAPVLNIQDETHYVSALALIEELMTESEDSADDPLGPMIDILARAISDYESRDPEIVAFEKEAREIPADIAMLSVLMDQYGLGVADFPEIGDKSLISRILSGSRNLTKQHIEKLSRRFDVEPGMFF